jgi:hypothetical protein
LGVAIPENYTLINSGFDKVGGENTLVDPVIYGCL